MAISYKIVAQYPDMRTTIVDVTLDASYAAGGYALSNASMGVLSNPVSVDATMNYATTQPIPLWDSATNKLAFFKSNTAAKVTECANTDLSTSNVCRLTVIGQPVV
jgi:hypothetical protein